MTRPYSYAAGARVYDKTPFRERARKKEREGKSKVVSIEDECTQVSQKGSNFTSILGRLFRKEKPSNSKFDLFFLYSSQLSVSTADIDFQESSVERPQTFWSVLVIIRNKYKITVPTESTGQRKKIGSDIISLEKLERKYRD